ncbi:MAG: hypothetical protein EP329_26305 [Deltaproteobacteria bacterium]|nr:MAG: hypothetical protein EP329_26305 [Deltaproteobacteria bacterium]
MTDTEPLKKAPTALARVAWPIRVGVGVALAAAAAIPLFGRHYTLWLVLLAVGALGWSAWHLWWATRGPGAILVGLEQRWLELHGARRLGRCAVVVHDGMQPLQIRLSRERRTLRADVGTPLPASTLTFRLWPADQAAPDFAGSPTRELTYDLERAPEVEALFAGRFGAESNHPAALRRIMTASLMAPLLTVHQSSPPGAFRGLTWDGRELAVHWAGPVVTDPTRALQLSRPIWRAFVDEA